MTLRLVYTNNATKEIDRVQRYDIVGNELKVVTYDMINITTTLTDVDHIVKIHFKTIYKNGSPG